MAISLVASATIPSPGTSTGVDTTGAEWILVAVASVNNFPLSSLSDNMGNTYRLLFDAATSAGNVRIFTFISVGTVTVGAGHTWTVAAGAFPSAVIAAFSGNAGVDFTEGPVSTTGTSTSRQAGSITPTHDDSLVIAALCYRDTQTVSIDSSFTIIGQNPFIGSTADGSALAYRILSSPSAVNPNWSWTNSQGSSAMNFVIAPIDSSGGGGGGGGEVCYVS